MRCPCSLLALVMLMGASCAHAEEVAKLPLSLLERGFLVGDQHQSSLKLIVLPDPKRERTAPVKVWLQGDGEPYEIKPGPDGIIKITRALLEAQGGHTLLTNQPKGSMKLEWEILTPARSLKDAMPQTYLEVSKIYAAARARNEACRVALAKVFPISAGEASYLTQGFNVEDLQPGEAVTLTFADGARVAFSPNQGGVAWIPFLESWESKNPKISIPPSARLTP